MQFATIARTSVSVALALVALEFACSLLGKALPPNEQLALPPRQTVEYETPDFQFVSQTNSLGFRGREMALAKPEGAQRIVVIGNSFAYGWGVNNNQTWPNLLEQNLSVAGRPVQVANLSTPGINTRMALEIANRAIPTLHPDLIILAVLQGAAVNTYQPVAAEDDRPVGTQQAILTAVSWAMPNFVRSLEAAKDVSIGGSHIPASAANAEWRKQAEAFIAQMTAEEQVRFAHLPKPLLDRLVSGKMNTPFATQAIREPDLFANALKPGAFAETAESEMGQVFAQVDALAKATNPKAKVIVLSMPYAAYQGAGPAQLLRDVGYRIPDLLNVDQAEVSISTAAADAGIPFLSVASEFRAAASTTAFIPYDGHYSETGTALFASLITDQVRAYLD